MVLPLLKCENDMTLHLISLGVSSKRGRSSNTLVTESQLILNRAGKYNLKNEEIAELTVCPKHRRGLTIDWEGRKKSVCCYPFHKGSKKQLKNVRRVNLSMTNELYELHQIAIPIGSGKSMLFKGIFFQIMFTITRVVLIL